MGCGLHSTARRSVHEKSNVKGNHQGALQTVVVNLRRQSIRQDED